MLKQSSIQKRLDHRSKGFLQDPFFVVPRSASLNRKAPGRSKSVGRTIANQRENVETRNNGAASIDLRLGTWFLVSRQTHIPVLEIEELSALELKLDRAIKEMQIEDRAKELRTRLLPNVRDSQIAHSHHVRFGEDFILHPRSFVLGVTLEWLRIPSNLAGYVTGRSSWGRRGLVIATATGVHPGFTGCLTLELSNLGDLPISIRPGMTIGQLFLHRALGKGGDKSIGRTSFACKRRPNLGHPKPDDIARVLSGAPPISTQTRE